MSFLRGASIAALIVAGTPLLGLQSGLDPGTQAKVAAAANAIRKAEAERRKVFLTREATQADRYRMLQEYRDVRRKAALEAAEALLAVRDSFPKEEWTSLVARLSDRGAMPRLVEQAKKELPSVVADSGRRKAAEKALGELESALSKEAKERESARKKFLRLLEKKDSSRDDFVSGIEAFSGPQEALDDRLVESAASLQKALTPEEWDELVRRITGPSGEGAGRS